MKLPPCSTGLDVSMESNQFRICSDAWVSSTLPVKRCQAPQPLHTQGGAGRTQDSAVAAFLGVVCLHRRIHHRVSEGKGVRQRPRLQSSPGRRQVGRTHTEPAPSSSSKTQQSAPHFCPGGRSGSSSGFLLGRVTPVCSASSTGHSYGSSHSGGKAGAAISLKVHANSPGCCSATSL